jgi:hypothetical protein
MLFIPVLLPYLDEGAFSNMGRMKFFTILAAISGVTLSKGMSSRS